jgi:hypothetical protein
MGENYKLCKYPLLPLEVTAVKRLDSTLGDLIAQRPISESEVVPEKRSQRKGFRVQG